MTREEILAMLECWGDDYSLCCFKCLVDSSIWIFGTDWENAIEGLQQWLPEAVDTAEKRVYIKAVALNKKVVWLNPYRDISGFYLD